MTRTAERRLQKAHDKVTDEVEDLDELEADMAEDLAEITETWADKAADIETMEIGLEKTDVSLTDLRLVWVPVA